MEEVFNQMGTPQDIVENLLLIMYLRNKIFVKHDSTTVPGQSVCSWALTLSSQILSSSFFLN